MTEDLLKLNSTTTPKSNNSAFLSPCPNNPECKIANLVTRLLSCELLHRTADPIHQPSPDFSTQNLNVKFFSTPEPEILNPTHEPHERRKPPKDSPNTVVKGFSDLAIIVTMAQSRN